MQFLTLLIIQTMVSNILIKFFWQNRPQKISRVEVSIVFS